MSQLFLHALSIKRNYQTYYANVLKLVHYQRVGKFNNNTSSSIMLFYNHSIIIFNYLKPLLFLEKDTISSESYHNITKNTESVSRSSEKRKIENSDMDSFMPKNKKKTYSYVPAKNKRNYKLQVADYRRRLKEAYKFSYKLKSKILGQEAINFCLSQLRKRNIKPKGRRYTTEEKILALSFYKQSGRAYSKFRQVFALPHRETISKLLNKVPIKAGVNNFIFENLKRAALTMNVRDRMCTLIFDEMCQ